MFKVHKPSFSRSEIEDETLVNKFELDCKTFVINLDHRKDRLVSITQELEKVGITDWERFPGIIPKAIPEQFLKNKDIKYRIGARGCLLSHLEILKKAKKENLEYILILEDDTIFKNDVGILKSQLKNNWDMIYLCGNHDKLKKINKNLAKINYTLTTNAYLVHSKIYDFLIENLEKCNREIDVFYANIHSKNNCYAIVPSLAYQKPDYSDILNCRVNYRASQSRVSSYR